LFGLFVSQKEMGKPFKKQADKQSNKKGNHKETKARNRFAKYFRSKENSIVLIIKSSLQMWYFCN